MGDLCWTILFLKDCMLWQGPHAVAGEECEEEGEAEVKCYELTATPIITWNAICSNKDTYH